MDISAEKELLIQEVKQINDISLLRALKYMIHFGMAKEGRISLEQYNLELDEAEARISNGEFFTQEEVEKMSKKW
jgi:hypothetical protein